MKEDRVMLNEERIKLMTKLASYEADEGKRSVRIGNYFRSDYISLGVIKSVICATIAFIVVFALYILYDFEEFMANIYKTDLVQFGKKILIIYFVFVVAYSIISYLVYTYRYTKARKSLKRYYNNLKKLAFLYEKENKK